MSDSESAPGMATAAEIIEENHEQVAAPATPGRKRTPAKPEVDADGNPLPTTPRKTAASKVDTDDNPLPKTPRKQATPKAPKLDADGNPVVATPKKSAGKAKAKAVKTEESQDEGSGGSQGDSAVAIGGSEADPAEVPLPPTTPQASKKRQSIGGQTETPSKRSKSTPVKANAIPASKAELSEQDKMLVEWKDAGRSWPDIKAEWARLTGKPPGGSTLNVRYGRLKASLVELKDGDMERLLIAKDVIDKKKAQELKEFKIQHAAALASFESKLEYGTWGRMVAMVEQMGGDKYNGDAAQKAYSKERLAGFPHKATEFYLKLALQCSPTEDGEPQETKDETEVDFDEDGNPVYTDTQEEAPPTVVKKSSGSEGSTNGSVNGSINGSIAGSVSNPSMRRNSLAKILADSAALKAESEQGDGAVFN